MNDHLKAIEFHAPAKLESIRDIIERVLKVARKSQLNDQAIFQCQLALDEACTNIIEHSYPDRTDGVIKVIIDAGDKECTIHLIDFGEPYDPNQIQAPSLDTKLETSIPGGLGLYLMRTVMDEVHYTIRPDGNRLTLIKRG